LGAQTRIIVVDWIDFQTCRILPLKYKDVKLRLAQGRRSPGVAERSVLAVAPPRLN
jgi:hypothetical protein